MQNQVNIDAIIEEVKNWDIHTEKLIQENEDFKKQILILEKRYDSSHNNEAQAREEVDQLRKVLSIMQETIEKLSTAEGENHKGKKEIRQLKENESYLHKLVRKKDREVDVKVEAMKELNMKELERMKQEFEDQIRKLKQNQSSLLEEKDGQIEKLKKQSSDLEREKQTEIMMLRLEYDEKLQRLQNQTMSSSQSTNSSSSSSLKNEILRKKLQHVQAEAEKEINGLKKKISEMETYSSKQQQQVQKRRKLSFQ